jgi:hypothetical protein
MPGPRLTYANVVSTLCLVIVLGGVADAAGVLDGGRLKSRSVSGKTLRKNTLTGKEINEAKLGVVPRATDAARLGGLAPTAFLRSGAKATDADTVDGLDSSAFLPASGKANDADVLDGVDSAGFVRTARFAAGQGSSAAVPAVAILKIPGLELTVLTDGDADTNFDVRIRNDGTSDVDVADSTAGGINTVNPGETENYTLPGAPHIVQFILRSRGPGNPTSQLTCGTFPFTPAIVCSGEALSA